MLLISMVAVLASVTQTSAGTVNFRGTGEVSKAEVSEILYHEMADVDHRLTRFEDALRHMFVSLPKNEHGKLPYEVMCYALHRFFMYRHGWFIDSLEHEAASNPSDLRSMLQSILESEVGNQGVDLRGLATVAASLEDLAEKETLAHLQDAYEANNAPMSVPVRHGLAVSVLQTFLISFLNSNNLVVLSLQDLEKKKNIFENKYRDYNQTMAWYLPLRDRHIGTANENVSFDSMAKAALEIGRTFHAYNDVTCKSMRSVLAGVESRRPGRVRLSAFYSVSIHSHFEFNEKVEFLRDLGALDESDPKQTSVIIPNYAMSKLNCLNATNLYSICCRNVCDDLSIKLEEEIGGPVASVERIVGLVSNLASESVDAPRELPEALVGRLHEVAAHHGGQVPIYGRLFAQWMHHAFPRECPYPQERGVASVQTPEEWIAKTGHATQEASPEEMQELVESDGCAMNWEGKSECSEELIDLPWSMTEELLFDLSGAGQVVSMEETMSALPLVTLLSLSLLLVWFLLSNSGRGIGRSGKQKSCVMAMTLLLAASAYFANLLDDAFFGVALLGSVVVAGTRLVAARRASLSPVRQAKVV